MPQAVPAAVKDINRPFVLTSLPIKVLADRIPLIDYVDDGYLAERVPGVSVGMPFRWPADMPQGQVMLRIIKQYHELESHFQHMKTENEDLKIEAARKDTEIKELNELAKSLSMRRSKAKGDT